MQTRILIVLLALPATLACGKTERSPQPEAASTVTSAPSDSAEDKAIMARIEAKDSFKKKCLVCHGESGAGDGPGSAALVPKPRDFGDPAWQNGVTDEQISKAIVGGGAAVGKSPIMPGNPELKSKPEVVKELVAIIRGFKK